MNDIADKIDFEKVEGNKYVVTRNGRAVTGPLPPLDAARVAGTLDNLEEDAKKKDRTIKRSMAFRIVLVLAILVAVLAGILTKDLAFGLVSGGVVFFTMSVGVFWKL